MCILNIIHLFYPDYLNETQLPSIDLEQSFGENNVTLTVSVDLERAHMSGLIYGILFTTSTSSTQMERIIIISDNTNIYLIVSYNSHYNLSVFSNLCGHELQSDPMHTFYGEDYITKLWAYI